MMNSPFFCSQCGRDLIVQPNKDQTKYCSECMPKMEKVESNTYKGLLGESTWWQGRK